MGMDFVGHDLVKERMEIFELKEHPYYVGCQFHPEYLSRPLKPSPPYLGLILAASKRMDHYIEKGCPNLLKDSPESSGRHSPCRK